MKILETKRLLLRTMREDDFDALYERVFSCEDICRYTFGSSGFSKEESIKFLKENANFSSSIGLSTLVEKKSGQIVGLSGLMPCDALKQEDLEIGFILSREAQGKGYAKEIGKAQMDFALHTLNKPRVLALAHPDNVPSLKAIEKLGFFYVKTLKTRHKLRKIFVYS